MQNVNSFILWFWAITAHNLTTDMLKFQVQNFTIFNESLSCNQLKNWSVNYKWHRKQFRCSCLLLLEVWFRSEKTYFIKLYKTKIHIFLFISVPFSLYFWTEFLPSDQLFSLLRMVWNQIEVLEFKIAVKSYCLFLCPAF